MRYTRNYVYNTVSAAVRAAFPAADCTSRFVQSPSAFPNVYIYELDYHPTTQGMQLDATDEQWMSTFEVQITSNKESGAATEAHKIMDVVRTAMAGMYYRQYNQAQQDNGTKFYLIGQFRRVIGGGDQTGG